MFQFFVVEKSGAAGRLVLVHKYNTGWWAHAKPDLTEILLEIQMKSRTADLWLY